MMLHRYYSERLMPFPHGKPPVLRSESHLKWVRARSCVATGMGRCDAHHVLRRSQGVNDYAAIPLSHEAHMELHTRGEMWIERKYGIDLTEALIATLVERISGLEEELRCARRT